MIYLDSSVVLARLFAETASPLEVFWSQRMMSSRLLEYEVFSRVNSRADTVNLAAIARAVIERLEFVELSPIVLSRARAPFPVPVRTLDGLHLATMDYLQTNGQTFQLASYDKRLIAAARAIGVAVASL